MAYKQKNNPFRQEIPVDTPPKTSQNNIDLAKRLNKMRFEMKHIYPIVSEEQIREEVKDKFSENKNKGSYWENPQNAKNKIQYKLKHTAQTEKERKELYNMDPSGHGTPSQYHAIYGETKSGEWGIIDKKKVEVSDTRIYREDLLFIKTAKEAGPKVFNKLMSLPKNTLINFQDDVIKIGKAFAGKKLDENPITTLNEVRKLDLSGFKQYLTKADIDVNDIKEIVTSQLNNLPDLNKDGTPDVFEGIKGNILRKGIDTVVNMKLKSLK